MNSERLDILVARQEGCSRQFAQSIIKEGLVSVNGLKVDKPGVKPAFVSSIIIAPYCKKYVSRGGLKLEAALDAFGVTVDGFICADIGASTGGFTDCLLQRGAKRVYAIDNGQAQLHPDLRADARVISLEKTNILTLGNLPEKPDIITVDISFISLALALPGVKKLGAGLALCLIKPQFECGPGAVNKRGIVTDPKVREGAIEKIKRSAQDLGFTVLAQTQSPIAGGDGNAEYWIELGALCK